MSIYVEWTHELGRNMYKMFMLLFVNRVNPSYQGYISKCLLRVVNVFNLKRTSRAMYAGPQLNITRVTC